MGLAYVMAQAHLHHQFLLQLQFGMAPNAIIDVLAEVTSMCPSWLADLDAEHVATEEAGVGVSGRAEKGAT